MHPQIFTYIITSQLREFLGGPFIDRVIAQRLTAKECFWDRIDPSS